MQMINPQFAARDGGDAVRRMIDSSRTADDDDECSSLSSSSKSKSSLKGAMEAFATSLKKQASDHLAAVQIDAQEKAKDRAAAELARKVDLAEREKDRVFQQEQSLRNRLSQLRREKRGYLCQMSERDEKRRRDGNAVDIGSANDYLLEAMNDVNAEIKEKEDALKAVLEVEANMTKAAQKSNVTPMRKREM